MEWKSKSGWMDEKDLQRDPSWKIRSTEQSAADWVVEEPLREPYPEDKVMVHVVDSALLLPQRGTRN
jgi:hypothetical protein